MLKHNIPRLFHIGTQKAGSTFLYNLLSSHPAIALSSQTEVHFYSKYYEKGRGWYINLFRKEGEMVDTSPKYFMHGEVVAPRIHEQCGDDARFVLILRNPIDLINSHFQMQVVSGHFRRHPDLYPIVPKNVVECVTLYPDYLKQALYHTELARHWLPLFGEHQFKIIIFERFIQNVDETMTEILTFWNLPLRSLFAKKTSKNKLLRSSWLFWVRSKVVKLPWLKDRLKSSESFARFYDTFLTSASVTTITVSEREKLANRLKEDVYELEKFLGEPVTEWLDFH